MTDRVQRMADAYLFGQTLEEVGRQFNLSRERVRQLLEKAGVGRRHKARRERPIGFRNPGNRYVYFARAGNGLIKIGCSSQPEARLSQIAEWVPFKIELAATIAGTYDLEAALHRMFGGSWSHLEWFHSTPELEGLIANVAAGRPFVILPGPENNVRREWIRAKKALTRKIHAAEQTRHPDANYPELVRRRPAYAQAAMDSFGPNKGAPTPEATAILHGYIAAILAEASARRQAA